MDNETRSRKADKLNFKIKFVPAALFYISYFWSKSKIEIIKTSTISFW